MMNVTNAQSYNKIQYKVQGGAYEVKNINMYKTQKYKQSTKHIAQK